jgi:hypothetical protein
MKTYEAGATVKAGTYLDVSTGQFLTVEGSEKASLPAKPEAKYVRVPLGLVLVLGPLIGLAYIIFLPLAGIGSLVVVAIHRLKGGEASLAPKPAKE